MKSITITSNSNHAAVGRLAGWSVAGTGTFNLRKANVGGEIVAVIDADVQPTVTLIRNLDVEGGTYVEGAPTAGVLYYD